jgi:hypothetical protein
MLTNSSRLAVIRGCRGLDVGTAVEELTAYDTTGNTLLEAAVFSRVLIEYSILVNISMVK